MNFKELLEGAEPKMPGAPQGIQIMTPQQFVAKAGDMPGENSSKEVDEGIFDAEPEPENAMDKLNRGERVNPGDLKTKYGNPLSVDQAQELNARKAQQTPINITQAQWDQAVKQGGLYYAQYLDDYKAAGNRSRDYRMQSDKDQRARTSGDYSQQDTGASKVDMFGRSRPTPMAFDNLGRPMNQNNPAQAQQAYVTQNRPAQPQSASTQTGTSNTTPGVDDVINPKYTPGPIPNGFTQINLIRPGTDPQIRYVHKSHLQSWLDNGWKQGAGDGSVTYTDKTTQPNTSTTAPAQASQAVAEDQEHLNRIRKLSGLAEATELPASSREMGSQEFQDYMKRIVGTPDVDKAGNVKVDKKGNEKYVTGKTKGDKYKMPYIHRSSVITYMSPDGKTFDEDAVKKTLAIRPKSLLKQNEKMKHSNGEFEQFFNVGFAALTGLALDEQTNNLIIVNTCPGAGSCKVDCFAMKGGKIQFQGPWQSDGRILTYLLNDPTGFFNQLSAEITAESNAGKKGDKKFPNGWQTTVRWHDAGDFFSPEYLDMALKMAAAHPDVKFYAYTKMAGAALAKKPDNFIINWSEGANTEQEKQIKAQDPSLEKTKNSRIVPEKLFYDLLAKDEKGNLKKTAGGAWQPASPEALAEMKQRIAKAYGISASSILSYDEYMAKRKSIPAGMKYNVIVAPGEGDISANDPGVLSTLLLRH